MIKEYVIFEDNKYVASYLKEAHAEAFVDKVSKDNNKPKEDYKIVTKERDFDEDNCFVYVYEGTSRLFAKCAIFNTLEDALIWKSKVFENCAGFTCLGVSPRIAKWDKRDNLKLLVYPNWATMGRLNFDLLDEEEIENE